MKLKTNTSLLVLYVCYWPGLEDRSSGPGSIVSRSLSRGEFASLSSKHGFFLAREKVVWIHLIVDFLCLFQKCLLKDEKTSKREDIFKTE